MEDYVVIDKDDRAPALNIPDQNGQKVNIEDFKGQWLVIFFYPSDDTPACTSEAIAFTSLKPYLADLNAQVIGISPDTKEQHQAFIHKHSLDVTLLSDPEKDVIKRYGAEKSSVHYGKETDGVNRSTFIINPQGIIKKIWKNVSVENHVQEVKEELELLQAKRD